MASYALLFRGAASTGSTLLYTVPAATAVLVTSVVVTNTSGTAQTFSLLLDDVSLATTVPVPANDSVSIEPKQVIEAGGTIKGLASATSVNFHISGLSG
jgi:hypothetical protein